MERPTVGEKRRLLIYLLCCMHAVSGADWKIGLYWFVPLVPMAGNGL